MLFASFVIFLLAIPPVDAFGQEQTIIRLEILANFTGTIENTSTQVVFQNNIYRTSGTNQTAELISTVPVAYQFDGQITEGITGNLLGGIPKTEYITLSSGDGVKQITGSYISQELVELPIAITYGLDTTPPPLTVSFSGPPPQIALDESITFERDDVIDAGVGLAYYQIQLSRSVFFNSAIAFTTTGSELVLGAGSLDLGDRYRRRGATDRLGNSIYSIPIAFTQLGGQATIGGGSSSSSIKEVISNTGQPTPLSDQCPTGDSSGNYFDGICSAISEPPVLINIPSEHQTADLLPRREKAYLKITEPKVFLYAFPNYDAPKPYTIYEYTPTFAYQDIYEYPNNTQNTYKKLPYGPKEKKIIGATNNLLSTKLSGTPTSQSSNYLFYWFVETEGSCADLQQYCPIDPVCREVGPVCYEN